MIDVTVASGGDCRPRSSCDWESVVNHEQSTPDPPASRLRQCPIPSSAPGSAGEDLGALIDERLWLVQGCDGKFAALFLPGVG